MKKSGSEKYFINIVLPIKDLRKKNGLTQVEFAKRVGVGLRFLRELEQGKNTVRMDKLMQVLEFLGYHLELKRNEPQMLIKHSRTDLMDTKK
ncbi:MAG: helix-turn-helix transcriptional regulator [Candidatus Omnitrophica bacterium]|nr:helix-turn-helix transcriptional regulator [Candidatus Omnitrophota bacterium]